MIVRQYETPFYRLALRVCGNPTLAEESATDSFYKIWKYAHQWNGQGKPESWMYRIVVRTTIDLQRKSGRWWNRAPQVTSNGEQDPSPGPLGLAIETEDQDRIRHALDAAVNRLKPHDRALVHLYYFEGQPLQTIAPILDIPTQTLKMRLARARQRLRKHLEADDVSIGF